MEDDSTPPTPRSSPLPFRSPSPSPSTQQPAVLTVLGAARGALWAALNIVTHTKSHSTRTQQHLQGVNR